MLPRGENPKHARPNRIAQFAPPFSQPTGLPTKTTEPASPDGVVLILNIT